MRDAALLFGKFFRNQSRLLDCQTLGDWMEEQRTGDRVDGEVLYDYRVSRCRAYRACLPLQFCSVYVCACVYGVTEFVCACVGVYVCVFSRAETGPLLSLSVFADCVCGV